MMHLILLGLLVGLSIGFLGGWVGGRIAGLAEGAHEERRRIRRTTGDLPRPREPRMDTNADAMAAPILTPKGSR